MTIYQPGRVHRFFSGIFHPCSRSQSPKPHEHKHIDPDDINKETHIVIQKDAHPLHSATSAQQLDCSRAPPPVPVDSHERVETESPGTQNGLHAPSSKPDTVRRPEHAVTLSHSPDVQVSGTAYDEAWSRLSEDDRANLSNETSIKALFEELDETDQQHQSNSWLKRGKMAAGLQYVSNICSYINLVATWIPLPELGAVLGLFKGIVAVGDSRNGFLVDKCDFANHARAK